MLNNLRDYNVMLASKSPRRRELLSTLRIPFTSINITGIDESYPDDMEKSEVPLFLANKKADAYLSKIKDNDLIITADTVVILENHIYGKPANREDAIEMLHKLAGKVHKVITGVCLLTSKTRKSFTTETEVKFAHLSDEEIEYYVDNYLPLDKAGSYGIQEWIGSVAVEWINGSFYNVMGLPVHQLYHELKYF